MAALYNDRNIRAKIQDFEKQLNTNEISIPTPRRRNTTRPTVATKPTVTPRASVSSTTEEETNTQMFSDDFYERFNSIEKIPAPPAVIPRPQIPRQPLMNSNDQFKVQPLIKAPPQLPSRPSLRTATVLNSQDEDHAFSSPPISSATQPPYNSHCSTRENEYVEHPVNAVLSEHRTTFTNTVSRKPTIIRVPSKQEQEVFDVFPTTLPVQKAIRGPPPSLRHKESFSSVCDLVWPPRPGGGKVLPSRPPSSKPSPGRPPTPRRDSVQRNSTLQSNKLRRDSARKSPVLPPRPNPGHRLYNKYTLEIPHAIAKHDYNGMHTGVLSFQKNEVLVLLKQTDSQTFECQVGDAKGSVHKSCMKIITPLASYSYRDCNPGPQESTSHQAFSDSAQNGTLQVQALYDFTPEGPGELGLRAGDILNNVEQIDSEWYLASSRGITGFFPINYVKILSRQPVPKPTPQKVSGPRCVARFDFEGEHSGELSFTEGQVIRILEYEGEDWARGEIGGHVGIFPLNFVEVLEDLPPSPIKNQSRVPLPGMAAANNTHAATSRQNQSRQPVPKPTPQKVSGPRCVARFDFEGEHSGELSFTEGQVIRILEYEGEDWARGEIGGHVGIFPLNFVEVLEDLPPSPIKNQSRVPLPGMAAANNTHAATSRQNQAYAVERVQALYDFTAETDDDLSFLRGDVIEVIENR